MKKLKSALAITHAAISNRLAIRRDSQILAQTFYRAKEQMVIVRFSNPNLRVGYQDSSISFYISGITALMSGVKTKNYLRGIGRAVFYNGMGRGAYATEWSDEYAPT